MSGRRNVGKTLTLLMMFLITVVVILVIFSYFTGLFGLVSSRTHDVSVSGVFYLTANQAQSGTLVFTLSNLSTTSVVGVSFNCSATQVESSSCGNLELSNTQGDISTSNPVMPDGTAGGSSVVQFVPGASFPPGTSSLSVTVEISFSDGSFVTQSLVLPTQA